MDAIVTSRNHLICTVCCSFCNFSTPTPEMITMILSRPKNCLSPIEKFNRIGLKVNIILLFCRKTMVWSLEKIAGMTVRRTMKYLKVRI